MALSKAGADRQAMHERLRQHSMLAWEAIQAGKPNPLATELAQDDEIRRYLWDQEISTLMDATRHLGNAPQRARELAATVRNQITTR
jgi:adenylosuccinate lyase